MFGAGRGSARRHRGPAQRLWSLFSAQLSLTLVSKAAGRGQCIPLFQTWGRSGPPSEKEYLGTPPARFRMAHTGLGRIGAQRSPGNHWVNLNSVVIMVKKMRRGESRPSQRLLSSRPFSEHTIYFSEHLLCARSTDRDRPLLPAVFLLRSAPAAGESGCSISQVRAGVGTRDSGKLGEDRVIGKRSKSLAKVAAGRAGS